MVYKVHLLLLLLQALVSLLEATSPAKPVHRVSEIEKVDSKDAIKFFTRHFPKELRTLRTHFPQALPQAPFLRSPAEDPKSLDAPEPPEEEIPSKEGLKSAIVPPLVAAHVNQEEIDRVLKESMIIDGSWKNNVDLNDFDEDMDEEAIFATYIKKFRNRS